MSENNNTATKALENELEALQTALAASENDTRIQVEARQADAERIQALEEENASLKSQIEKLLVTPDADEKVTGVGETFEFEGQKYKILVEAVRIPGVGRRTAMEILVDQKAQAKLVETKSGVIRKLA